MKIKRWFLISLIIWVIVQIAFITMGVMYSLPLKVIIFPIWGTIFILGLFALWYVILDGVSLI